MKNLIVGTLLASIASVGVAHAGGKCSEPVANWQPREALESKLKAAGWDVRSIKAEDGCYEAYAIDPRGEKVEAHFNPKTLEQIDGSGDDDSDES